MSQYQIASFYHFEKIDPLSVQSALLPLGDELGLGGLVIVAKEGLNGTVAAPSSAALAGFQDQVRRLLNVDSLSVKFSTTDNNPYKRFKVKVREEIVTTEFGVTNPKGKHLTPSEWDRFVDDNPGVTILDTRNWYETRVGLFEDAVDLDMVHFSDFPEKVEQLELKKEAPVLMYCTGGIRCEKASVLMENMGFQSVYQLEGGILKYFEDTSAKSYKGECFVFDGRVSVDKDLKPSEKWKLCPHTGQPGTKDITCAVCSKHAVLSPEALHLGKEQTCSKDCSEKFKRTLCA